MREGEVVLATDAPATVETLTANLMALGVEPGMVLLVHSSPSALGLVCGGTGFARGAGSAGHVGHAHPFRRLIRS